MPSVDAGTTDPALGPRRFGEQAHVNPDLLSSICHDLKAPLASIVMGAGFLRQVVSPENAAALRVLDAIRRASERMSQLIISFSDLAKLELHELTLQVRPYELGALVRTAIEQFLPDATAQGVPVALELSPDASTLRLSCDRDRVLQILRHLTTCALRVVPEGGDLTIRIDVEGTDLPRFEIVTKCSAAANARGIGTEPSKPDLAIARGLIELHGGRLIVVGDEGALTLSFTLPGAPHDR
jgi:signal transduction histidine kinase